MGRSTIRYYYSYPSCFIAKWGASQGSFLRNMWYRSSHPCGRISVRQIGHLGPRICWSCQRSWRWSKGDFCWRSVRTELSLIALVLILLSSRHRKRLLLSQTFQICLRILHVSLSYILKAYEHSPPAPIFLSVETNLVYFKQTKLISDIDLPS